MQNRFENGRNMWGATDHELTQFNDVISVRAPFMRYVAMFRNARMLLDTAALKQGKELGGIREDKEAIELRAAEKADYIGDILQAYALEHEQHELYRAMMFSTYDIVNMRDTIGYDKMMEVYARGQELVNELTDYGLRTDDLKELDSLAGTFKKRMDEPRSAIVDRSVATDDIAAIYRAGNKALHVMDKMVNTFASVSPEFVAAYKKARIIVDQAGGRNGDEPVK